MREIEFRGKRKDTGEWVYGDLVHSYGGMLYLSPFERYGDFYIHPETVGQYTGLLDKNGVKIFEGDIIKDNHGNIGVISYSDHFHQWQIAFHKGRPDLLRRLGSMLFQWVFPKMHIEVIGNTHDNRELLEVHNIIREYRDK